MAPLSLVILPTKAGAFLDTVAEVAPRDFILYHDKIHSFAEARYKKELPPYDSPFQDFTVPAPIQRWVDENIQVNHTPKKKIAALKRDDFFFIFPLSRGALRAPVPPCCPPTPRHRGASQNV